MNNIKDTTWQKVKLGDVISINAKSIDARYPHKNIDYIDISSVGSGVLSGTVSYSLDKAPSRAKRLVQDKDILLSTVRPGRRSFLLMNNPKDNLVVSTGFAVLSAKEELINKRFLYYLVTRQHFTDYLVNNSKGSAYPAVSTDVIADAELSMPNLSTQKRIAEFLGAFDDEIEINNKIIKNLEELAQTIFKEWFVKFRFPGYKKVKMVDSELGKIPKGWETKPIGELVERLPSGETYTPETVSFDGAVPVYDQSSDSVLGYHNDDPGFMATTEKPIAIFGDHTCRMELLPKPFSLGPNTIPFIGVEYPTLFVYFVSRVHARQQEYKRHWTEFYNNMIVVPRKDIADEFCLEIQSYITMIEQKKTENITLAQMRDLFLPKVMKGEMKV